MHFNYSVMQIKQQTTGHNNILLLGVHAWRTIRGLNCQGWSLQSRGHCTRSISTDVLYMFIVLYYISYHYTGIAFMKYSCTSAAVTEYLLMTYSLLCYTFLDTPFVLHFHDSSPRKIAAMYALVRKCAIVCVFWSPIDKQVNVCFDLLDKQVNVCFNWSPIDKQVNVCKLMLDNSNGQGWVCILYNDPTL